MARPTQDHSATLVEVEVEIVGVASDDLGMVVEHGRRALFGALAIAVEILARGLAESVPASPRETQRIAVSTTQAADAAMGIAWWLTQSSTQALASGVRRAGPVVAVLVDPPLLPSWLSIRKSLRRKTETWVSQRPDAIQGFLGLGAMVTGKAGDMVGPLLTLEAALDRALEHVDLDALVDALLADLDLDRLLARAIADVDLPRIVDEALGRLDLTKVVLDNVDLVTVAQAVIDGVDLPAIVRESSGSIASETVDTVRLQGIDADRAVARIVDRLLLRRTQGTR